MAVLQTAGTHGSLFGGTNTYTRTGLSAISAGQGVIVYVSSNFIRSITSVVLGSTGTTTPLTLIGSISTTVYVFAGTASGSETNTNIVVTASGSIGDDTDYGVLVVDTWNSDQSGADIEVLTSSTDTWAVPSVTPPTASNLIVAAVLRGNRGYTDDPDFTYVSLAGTNLAAFGYIVQAAATAQGLNFTADLPTQADIVLIAFAGSGGGGGGSRILNRQLVLGVG